MVDFAKGITISYNKKERKAMIPKFLTTIQRLFTTYFFTTQKPFVYVALGDSTVEGIGATTSERCFAAIVYAAIKQEVGSAVFYNLGKRGARVKDVLANQLTLAIEKNPDLVVLSMGGNDIRARTPLKKFSKDYEIILQRLRSETNALIVVNSIPDFSMATVIPRFLRFFAQFGVRRLNTAIRNLTGKVNGVYVDVYSHGKVFQKHEGLVAADGFHPSDIGYALWGNTIITQIKELLNKQQLNQSLTI